MNEARNYVLQIWRTLTIVAGCAQSRWRHSVLALWTSCSSRAMHDALGSCAWVPPKGLIDDWSTSSLWWCCVFLVSCDARKCVCARGSRQERFFGKKLVMRMMTKRLQQPFNKNHSSPVVGCVEPFHMQWEIVAVWWKGGTGEEPLFFLFLECTSDSTATQEQCRERPKTTTMAALKKERGASNKKQNYKHGLGLPLSSIIETQQIPRFFVDLPLAVVSRHCSCFERENTRN